MGITKLTFAVAGLILLCNSILYYIVKIDGSSLILTVAVALTELVAIIFVLWYWEEHLSIKRTNKFHHLP